MEALIGPNHFSFTQDKHVTDPDGTLATLVETPGFISAVVARKAILTSISQDTAEQYGKLGFDQVYAFYAGIRKNPRGVLTSEVFVDCRYNPRDLDWELFFVFRLGRIFNDLGTSEGDAKWALDRTRDAVLKTFILRKILNGRLNGAKTDRIKEMLIEEYPRTMTFAACAALLTLPLPILMLAISVNAVIAKRRGSPAISVSP